MPFMFSDSDDEFRTLVSKLDPDANIERSEYDSDIEHARKVVRILSEEPNGFNEELVEALKSVIDDHD